MSYLEILMMQMHLDHRNKTTALQKNCQPQEKITFLSQNIVNTHDLRRRLSANLEVPEDDIMLFTGTLTV